MLTDFTAALNPPSVRKVKHFPFIQISDTHFGKKSASADMLYEFLLYHTCDTLLLTGDIVDGWHLEKKDHRKFPEMQKRVMDLINARVASGMKVIYLPGNHDEKLRSDKNFGKNFFGIHMADSVIYTDPQNRRFLILHGDQFDPNFLKEGPGKFLTRVMDAGYDGLIELNALTTKAARRLLSKHFSIAAYAKRKAKDFIEVIGKFEDVAVASVLEQNVDGLLCGHIHHAEFVQKGPILYGNSGDWVESCTALTCNVTGEWDVVHWLDDREKFGLDAHPDEHSAHEYAAYRDITDRQLRLFQRIWPSADRAELREKQRERRELLEKTTRKIVRTQQDLKL